MELSETGINLVRLSYAWVYGRIYAGWRISENTTKIKKIDSLVIAWLLVHYSPR